MSLPMLAEDFSEGVTEPSLLGELQRQDCVRQASPGMPCDEEEGMHQEWQSSGTNACDKEQEETQQQC